MIKSLLLCWAHRRLCQVLPLVCGVLLTAVLAVGVQAEEAVEIRVLSYNIHHAEGLDRQLDLERIARIIRDASPDFVALQEVDVRTERSDKVDQAAELGRLAKMQFAFGSNLKFSGGDYGNAVLTPHKIVSHKNHSLPKLDAGEQRGVLAVEVSLGEGKPQVLFFATHLDHRPPEDSRLASAKFINDLMAEAKLPMVLVGDLNTEPGSPSFTVFTERWQPTTKEPLFTFPADKPRIAIDHVLVDKQHPWEVVVVQVLDEPVASDHRPLLATLRLRLSTAESK